MTREELDRRLAEALAKALVKSIRSESPDLIDECHQHKDSTLLDVMTKASGARRAPLTLKITSKT